MDTNSAYRQKRILLFLVISVGYLVVFFQRVAPAIVGPVMAGRYIYPFVCILPVLASRPSGESV